MEQRGVRLSSSGVASARRPGTSAHLGSTFRSVLIDPARGFSGILERRARRDETGARLAEGIAPYVLSSIGGISGMLVWLKIGSLVGAREVAGSDFRWSLLVAAAVIGALVAVAAQALWALIARIPLATTESAGSRSELRLVWGAAAVPQVIALLLLFPLDLLIVGPDTFTSTRLVDPLATGWAALSIALSVSAWVWSAYLLYRGTSIASGSGGSRAVIATATAALSAAVIVAAVAGIVMLGGS